MGQREKLVSTPRRVSQGKAPSPGAGTDQILTPPGNRDLLSHLGAGRPLPSPVQAKMEQAMDADFSAVRLHESPLVAQGGAEAAASGTRVAFAPGKLDLGSTAGLELLGHELSHVASQARGEVAGSGLVQNAALERKADQEGARAAHGGLSPLSGASIQPGQSGAVQCKKKEKAPTPLTGEVSTGQKMIDAVSKLSNPKHKVEAMRRISLAKSLFALDPSEMEHFHQLSDSVANDDNGAYLDTLHENQIGSAQKVLAMRAKYEKKGMSRSESEFRVLHSDAGLRFNSYVGQAQDIYQENDRRRYSDICSSDPEAQHTMSKAGSVMSNAHQSTYKYTVPGMSKEDSEKLKERTAAKKEKMKKNWRKDLYRYTKRHR